MADYAVLFTARARADLLQARRWLSQPGSGLKARLRITRITRALTELRFSPNRWPSGDIAGTRRRSVEGYAIIYRVDEQARRVQVLRVFGPYQDRAQP